MSEWPHVKLEDCCEIVSGATPSTTVASYWDGEVCWATPKDLSELDGAYISDTPRKITAEGLNSCAASVLPPQSVLFSSRAPIGHVAINTVPMATNQGFKSFVPKDGRVHAKFLYHWLRMKRSWLESLGNGATFKEVSKAIVSRIEIPLPPLAEQRRIAAILDQADALRTKRRQALTELNTLTQSIFLEMFGDPATNPKQWPSSDLQSVVRQGTIVTYGIVQAGEEYPGGVPYIRTGDIVDGRIETDHLRHTDPAIAAKFERSRVSSGDIVMSIRATVGTTAVVPDSLDGANLTQGTAKIAPGDAVEAQYLLHFLRSPGTQRWIRKQIKGATFLEITLTRLRELPVLLPPRTEQRKFTDRVALLDSVKLHGEASFRGNGNLFNALQTRAFRGEL